MVVGAGTVILNVVLFLGTVPFFLQRVHHHWIVPSFCALLLIETILYSRCEDPWRIPLLRAVLSINLLIGFLLFWRQFSMFHCFRHCEGRLSIGLLLLSLSFLAVRGGTPVGPRRALGLGAIVFGLWAIVVALIGWVHGTWNFC